MKRINQIAFRNTDTTKDIIKHQVQLNEYNKFKDLSRQFNYRKKMDSLLHENKKIYGNLARIGSQRAPVEDGVVEPNLREKEFHKKFAERSRVVGMLELEKENLRLAQKIASA